jgi:uncharacterized membrane-anchored protein
MPIITLIALTLIGLFVLGLITIVYSGIVGGTLMLVDKAIKKVTKKRAI